MHPPRDLPCIDSLPRFVCRTLQPRRGRGRARTNSLVCDPFSCDVNNITNAVSDSTYADCDGKFTGQSCTPRCVPGYEIRTSPYTFTLLCDINGDFDGSNDLVCEECTTAVASDGTSACAACNEQRPE